MYAKATRSPQVIGAAKAYCPKRVNVVCVGPAQTVRGGVTRVIEQIKNRIPDDINFRMVCTFSQYTGGDHPERASRLLQAMVFAKAFVRILHTGVVSRNTIFHIHLSMRGSTLRKGLICLALRVLRCRYVVHAHASTDEMFHTWVPAAIRRVLVWGIAGADSFIVLTQFWEDYYARTMHLPADRLFQLPNPAALPISVPNRKTKDGVNILFLGRIGKRKGAFESIRAFAALPKDIRECSWLTLAGDGETDAARDLTVRLGCSSRTTIRAWVEREEADRLLAEADVFLLPSHGEGMSMALLEGMAWGLAVVTTASGGADEFLAAERNCILVKPGDIRDISTALCALAQNSQLRLRLGAEARRTAARFSVDGYIERLTRLYKELASDSRPRNRTR